MALYDIGLQKLKSQIIGGDQSIIDNLTFLKHFFEIVQAFNWVRFLLVSHFGSLDSNENKKCNKNTTKCSQYDVTMTLIDEFHKSK